jgi:hypothetical protein
MVTVPPGYTAEVFVAWGDPIMQGGTPFTGTASADVIARANNPAPAISVFRFFLIMMLLDPINANRLVPSEASAMPLPKEKFSLFGLDEYREFIHLGLTSQDINNTAFPLAVTTGM